VKQLSWLLLLFCACGTPQQDFELPPTNNYILPDSLSKLSPTHQVQAILGRTLFYDPIVSRDSSMSCGSCHMAAAAFGDRLQISRGIYQKAAGVRNTPPLFNLFWRSGFFRDGGIPRLEQVALAPMQNHDELDLPLEELTLRLRQNQAYLKSFQEVYGLEPDPYTITRAFAWFQRSLISLNSPFDAWQAGRGELSEDAKAGWALFQGERLNCQGCHPAPAFSDDQFHHIGLASEGIDTGRAQISYEWDDFGKFRTPSLRNLSFTSPYMHDGSIASLEEVVAYFNRGGDAHQLKHPNIRPLGLSVLEQKQLIAFLKSLDDSVFTQWPAYQRQAADYLD
jgi:cytochrome c peroxidase